MFTSPSQSRDDPAKSGKTSFSKSFSTKKSEMKIGIWKTIGRHAAYGLILFRSEPEPVEGRPREVREDLFLEVLQHEEERDEDRNLENDRETRRIRVDLVQIGARASRGTTPRSPGRPLSRSPSARRRAR